MFPILLVVALGGGVLFYGAALYQSYLYVPANQLGPGSLLDFLPQVAGLAISGMILVQFVRKNIRLDDVAVGRAALARWAAAHADAAPARRRIAFKGLAGLAVAPALLYGSLKVLDHSGHGAAAAIEVVEATYGMNCRSAPLSRPSPYRIVSGNATSAVVDLCTGKGR